jgi:SAM-dependent methyltransferase
MTAYPPFHLLTRLLPPWNRRGEISAVSRFVPDGLDPILLEWLTQPADLRRILRFKRALDLGCGPGLRAIFLARQGHEVTAMEGDPATLRSARALAKRTGVQVSFLEGADLPRDARPPFDRAFDLVLDYGLFHRLEAEERPLYRERLRFVTDRGSRVIVMDLLSASPGRRSLTEHFEGLFTHLDERRLTLRCGEEEREAVLFHGFRRD